MTPADRMKLCALLVPGGRPAVGCMLALGITDGVLQVERFYGRVTIYGLPAERDIGLFVGRGWHARLATAIQEMA